MSTNHVRDALPQNAVVLNEQYSNFWHSQFFDWHVPVSSNQEPTTMTIEFNVMFISKKVNSGEITGTVAA
jgi:hypothetical protein